MSGTEERGYRVIKKAVPMRPKGERSDYVPRPKGDSYEYLETADRPRPAAAAANRPVAKKAAPAKRVAPRPASSDDVQVPVDDAQSRKRSMTRSSQFSRVSDPGTPAPLAPHPGQTELPVETPRVPVREPLVVEKVARPQRVDNHPVATHHGGTYPMFMTGHEIREQYQALDGDRHDVSTEGATRAQSYTATHSTRDSEYNNIRIPAGHHVGKRYHWDSTPESDHDLYDRKYDEADFDGLADRINDHGYDWRHPVSLANGRYYGDYSAVTGSQDKYQVLGGHHRVAVMSQDHPRQFIPVSHHDDIYSAKRENKGY
jgi:hypothetical protein